MDDFEIGDMNAFLKNPVPKGVIVQCTIKRDKSGLVNKIYPTYHVHLSKSFKYLMSGKKKGLNKTSNYYISS